MSEFDLQKRPPKSEKIKESNHPGNVAMESVLFISRSTQYQIYKVNDFNDIRTIIQLENEKLSNFIY